MGKGTIISGGTDGLYTIRPEYDFTRLENEVTVLTTQIASFTAILAGIDAEIADWDDNIQQVLDELDTLDPNDPDDQAEYADYMGDFNEYHMERVQVVTRKKLAQLQEEQAKKRKAGLEALKARLEAPIDAWCADLTEDLEPDTVVATVEVPNELGGNTIQIRPAYSDSADYQEERDGHLAPALAQTPSGTFYNAAMLPGKQKWAPQYRYGTIRTIAPYSAVGDPAQTCTVDLVDEVSSQQSLNVNYESVLLLVPAVYMDCDLGAFTAGDEVLIEFEDRDWDKPTIIGFKKNPEKCEWRIFALIKLRLIKGYGGAYEEFSSLVTPINLDQPFESGNQEMAEVSTLWDCDRNRVVNVSGASLPTLSSNWEQKFFDMLEIDDWGDLATPVGTLFNIKLATPYEHPWDWYGDREARPPCEWAYLEYEGGSLTEFPRVFTHSKWNGYYQGYEDADSYPSWFTQTTRGGSWSDALWSKNVWFHITNPVGCNYYDAAEFGTSDGFNNNRYPMFPNPWYCYRNYNILDFINLGTYIMGAGGYYPLVPGYTDDEMPAYVEPPGWTLPMAGGGSYRKSCSGSTWGIQMEGPRHSDPVWPMPRAPEAADFWNGNKGYAMTHGDYDRTFFQEDPLPWQCTLEEHMDVNRYESEAHYSGDGGFFVNNTHLTGASAGDAWTYGSIDVGIISGSDIIGPSFNNTPFIVSRHKTWTNADQSGTYMWSYQPWSWASENYPDYPTFYGFGNDETFKLHCLADDSDRIIRCHQEGSQQNIMENDHRAKWLTACRSGRFRFSAWAKHDYHTRMDYKYTMKCDQDPDTSLVAGAQEAVSNEFKFNYDIEFVSTYDMSEDDNGKTAWDFAPEWAAGANTGFWYDQYGGGSQFFRGANVQKCKNHRFEWYPWSKGYWMDPDAVGGPTHVKKLQIGFTVLMTGLTDMECLDWHPDNMHEWPANMMPLTDFNIYPSSYNIEAICGIPEGDAKETNPYTEGGVGTNSQFEQAINSLIQHAHSIHGNHQEVLVSEGYGTPSAPNDSYFFFNSSGNYCPSRHRYTPWFSLRILAIPKNRTAG